MLRITSDVFSGRPNPSWIIEDEAQARELLRETLNLSSSAAAMAGEEQAGLGFRGFVVEPMADDLAKDFSIEAAVWLPAGLTKESSGRALFEQLIQTAAAPTAAASTVAEGEEMPVVESLESLQQFLLNLITVSSRETVQEGVEAPSEALAAAPAATCYYELAAYNPAYWNNNATIRSRNNCYNYASNKRTDTFAQPGRGCGRMYTALTCAEVTRAALCDRLHRRYDCFPDSEKPRYLVALVIWPGRDFHWYRLNSGGFWSHKPGSTAVRNVDNSGRIIRNPATCDRGGYTQFCGYFYTCRSQLIR